MGPGGAGLPTARAPSTPTVDRSSLEALVHETHGVPRTTVGGHFCAAVAKKSGSVDNFWGLGAVIGRAFIDYQELTVWC